MIGTETPKVLLLGQDLSLGGSGKHFRTLAKHLFAGTCDVLTLRSDPPEWNKAGYKSTSLNLTSELGYPHTLHLVRQKVLREGYDAAFAFGPYPNLVLSFATRGLKKRPSTILCEINRPIIAMKNNARRPQTRLVNWLLPRAYRGADMLVANSLDGVEEPIVYFGVPREKVFRVPNLIDAAETREHGARPVGEEWPESKPTIVVCGRLVPWKRVDTVIQSVEAIRETTPSNLVIIGDGPDRQRLEQMAHDLGLANAVHFLGWQQDPLPYIARADVSVTASEYEGFSNSIIEAMFLQVPNVTSLSTSDARAMCLKKAALGFRVGDVDGLSEAIRRLLTTPTLCSEIVRIANSYSAAHELSTAIPVYEGLIQKAIQDHRVSRS